MNDPIETWAIVSLMGHKTYAGKLSEEEKFGVKLGRLEIPQDDGTFRTVHFGGQSVYSIEAVTEAVARVRARSANPTPISPWDFPKALASPEHADATSRAYEFGGEEAGDDEPECEHNFHDADGQPLGECVKCGEPIPF